MEAILCGHEHLVMLLIEARCSIEIANDQGLTPLLLAITLKNHLVLNMLLENGANRNTVSFRLCIAFSIILLMIILVILH